MHEEEGPVGAGDHQPHMEVPGILEGEGLPPDLTIDLTILLRSSPNVPRL